MKTFGFLMFVVMLGSCGHFPLGGNTEKDTAKSVGSQNADQKTACTGSACAQDPAPASTAPPSPEGAPSSNPVTTASPGPLSDPLPSAGSSCEAAGKRFALGETWRAGCNTCTCTANGQSCTSRECEVQTAICSSVVYVGEEAAFRDAGCEEIALACVSDKECTGVSGGCVGLAPVAVAYASSYASYLSASDAMKECSEPRKVAAYQPACKANKCVIDKIEYADALPAAPTTCTDDSQCWCQNFDGAQFLPGKSPNSCVKATGKCQECTYE